MNATKTTGRGKTLCERCYFGEIHRKEDNEKVIYCIVHGYDQYKEEWNLGCHEFSPNKW